MWAWRPPWLCDLDHLYKLWSPLTHEAQHEEVQKGTSRQRSGKGAIRKSFPPQKRRREKTKLTIRYLYNENIS